MVCPHSPPDTVVVSHPPVCQVIRGCAVGDKHAGRAAVPGSVQRAGPQVCHGRQLPGPAGQLRRQTVSTAWGPTLERVVLLDLVINLVYPKSKRFKFPNMYIFKDFI